MRKKFLAALLATSLAFTVAPVIPAGMAVIAAAEETASTELTCDVFFTAHTSGQEVTESGTTITFKSISDATATNNWETPLVVAYTADEPVVNGAGYKEYVVVRSDNWAWGPEGVAAKDQPTFASSGYSMTSNIDGDASFSWSEWLEANKAGTDCKVYAVKKGGNVQIEFTNGTLTSTTTFPVEDGKKVYISLSGEKCKLTDIKTSGAETGDTTPDAPTTSATPDTPATPDTTDTPAAPAANLETELTSNVFLEAQTTGQEVTDTGMALTFKNTSDASATNNWETPVVIAYTGDEPVFNGAGYKEYVVVRSDNWAWGPEGVGDKTTATWTSSGYNMTSNLDTGFVIDWAAWLEANKSGTECKVQAIKADGKVYIEFTNGDITSLTSFPVTGDGKVYISLSGEKSSLTDIKTASYTGISGISSTPADPGTADPGTADPGVTDPGDDEPGVTDPGDSDDEPETTVKKTIKITNVVAKANTKKITGKVSVKGAKVKVKVGNAKKFSNATVKNKKFTFTTSKLKKGTKIQIKVTKSGCKTATKNVTVK